MKILLALLTLCAALNARAATYLLLSQTNTFAGGITNRALTAVDAAFLTNRLAAPGDPAQVLRGDATWGAAGGGGNITNTGASAVGQFPVYTDTTGTQVSPTNHIPSLEISELIVSNATASAWAYFDAGKVLTNAPYTPQPTSSVLTAYATIPTNTFAPNASPALTGNPTVNGQSLETQLTNKVDKTLTTDQSMSGRLLVPSLTVGSMAVVRGTLTHDNGAVLVDFAATNRYWSCSITGNVSFAISNAVAGKWANVMLRMPATNCTPTFSFVTAGSVTNWLGGAPSTLTANTLGFVSFYAIDSTTNSTVCAYAETQ